MRALRVPCLAAASFVAVDVEFCPVVEGDDAAFDAGDVAASKELRVEAVVTVLVQGDFLGRHEGLLSVCALSCGLGHACVLPQWRCSPGVLIA